MGHTVVPELGISISPETGAMLRSADSSCLGNHKARPMARSCCSRRPSLKKLDEDSSAAERTSSSYCVKQRETISRPCTITYPSPALA
jgi:hypothetical protein